MDVLKKVLMIAFHFPPFSGSSGVQRTLRFVQHFPALGWQPLVLTAHARAYEKTSPDLLHEVPDGTVVRRAFALDTARHLQIQGHYLACMSRPDRWISWKIDAIRQGLRLIEAYKPALIWSTYPIASAHAIASVLQKKTSLPWVADFRDPMAQVGYPADPKNWLSYKAVEADAAKKARTLVFTSPSAARLYQQRYPEAENRIHVVENGYDEESFSFSSRINALSEHQYRETFARTSAFVLLHSGIVYPSERDPSHLFEALSRLKQSGRLNPSCFRVRFRASGHDGLLKKLGQDYGVSEFIEQMPSMPYREALAEMLAVDALLVMQASNCNAQIPAKIYEYLRVGKPILGLTDPEGDTAKVLENAGITTVARLNSTDEIAGLLPTFIDQCLSGLAVLPQDHAVEKASRRRRSESMAMLLNQALI